MIVIWSNANSCSNHPEPLPSQLSHSLLSTTPVSADENLPSNINASPTPGILELRAPQGIGLGSFSVSIQIPTPATSFRSLARDTAAGALFSAAAASAQASANPLVPAVPAPPIEPTAAGNAPIPTLAGQPSGIPMAPVPAQPTPVPTPARSVRPSVATENPLITNDFLTLPASLLPEATGSAGRNPPPQGLVAGAAAVGLMWLI